MNTRPRPVGAKARKSPKQERSKLLVESVLEAATRVFDREGLDATTNRVALEAGVSVGSLYQYFPNKEALLVALAERHVAAATAAIDHAAQQAQDADSLSGFVRSLVRAVLDEHRHHAHLRPLLRNIAPGLPALAAKFEACIEKGRRALVDAIHRFEPGCADAELRAHLVVATVDGVVHGTAARPQDDALEDALVDLCVGYLEG